MRFIEIYLVLWAVSTGALMTVHDSESALKWMTLAASGILVVLVVLMRDRRSFRFRRKPQRIQILGSGVVLVVAAFLLGLVGSDDDRTAATLVVRFGLLVVLAGAGIGTLRAAFEEHDGQVKQ